jgi:imidazolonepropionase-like amidohydrolase
VFDGTGAEAADADVVLEDGRIVDVGPGLDGDDGVDVSGRTLLPGLFDCHVHLAFRYEDFDEVRLAYTPFSYRFFQFPETLRWYLAMGITTVRDAGGADWGMKRAVEDGVLPGPRMQISVTMLSMTGGHADAHLPCGGIAPYAVPYPGMPSPVADGPEALRAKVREVIREGADVIKIASSGGFLSPGDDPKLPHFGSDELEAIVTTAADLGRWVMSHAHGAEGIKRAVRAGVRSIEHGSLMDDEAIDLMAERGTYLVADIYDGDWIAETGRLEGWSENSLRKNDETTQAQRDGFEKAVAKGVKIAYGTDSGVYPHEFVGRQMAKMVKHGMTPMQAIRSATVVASELMGWQDRVGALEAGRFADVIAVAGDPIEDITEFERVTFVMKGGEVVLG